MLKMPRSRIARTRNLSFFARSARKANDGVFVGTVKVDSPTVDGKVRHYSEIESFAPYEGDKDLDAWQALADRSYEEQAKAIEERAKREKRGGGYGSKRRGSGTGTGDGGEDLF